MEQQNYFKDIVGQDVAKKKLTFFIKNYEASSILPTLMFVAPKGCGKTTVAKAVGRCLKNSEGKTKKFLEINCSTVKSLKQFFNQIIIPHVNGQEVTVLLDEASELPKDVTMALLTILNPNPENFTQFSYEDYVVDFDFRRISFMMATTEAQSIFHALMDRCERVDLEEYSYDDLAEIINRVTNRAKFSDGVLEQIAPVLRGNARAAQKMSNHINSFMASTKGSKFGIAEWDTLKDMLGTLPLGLSRIELQLLRILSEKKQCSLTYLAAKTGLTKSCLQRDFEMYLQKEGLMEIDRGGRQLTAKGQEYLKALDEVESIEPVKPVEPVPPAPKPKKKPVKIVLPDAAPVEDLVPLIPEDLFEMKSNAGRS
jgi:Holliday junction resolvasome RuvABC ATP-dependent DNA helicase subunit